MKILVIEDEKLLADSIKTLLEGKGFEVEVAYDGETGAEYAELGIYDLLILDVMMPKMDGYQVAREVRAKRCTTSILMLTAKSAVEDRIYGLNSGADYYLTKPFGTEELLARIRAAVRHTRTPDGATSVANSGVFTAGDLTIDYAKHHVYIAGRDANLTQNEYKLVALLGLHAGKVLTYDYLIKELWGPSARSDNQILRVNMANIRRKIEKNPAQPAYIFTESGVGYRMVEGA